MDTNYWIGRWERGETGWHKDEVNPYLIRHWPAVQARPAGRVLVPLCGSSLDLGWLAAQGHPVLGVEVSELAVRQFFERAGLSPAVERRGAFECFRAGGVEIACGDFFALDAAALGPLDAVYDRASLIALSPPQRTEYSALLNRLLPPAARMLVITLEYDQSLRAGPPFSVAPSEVRAHFEGRFEIEQLCDDDILAHNPGFVEAGIPWLREHAFALTPRTL